MIRVDDFPNTNYLFPEWITVLIAGRHQFQAVPPTSDRCHLSIFFFSNPLRYPTSPRLSSTAGHRCGAPPKNPIRQPFHPAGEPLCRGCDKYIISASGIGSMCLLLSSRVDRLSPRPTGNYEVLHGKRSYCSFHLAPCCTTAAPHVPRTAKLQHMSTDRLFFICHSIPAVFVCFTTPKEPLKVHVPPERHPVAGKGGIPTRSPFGGIRPASKTRGVTRLVKSSARLARREATARSGTPHNTESTARYPSNKREEKPAGSAVTRCCWIFNLKSAF